MSLIAPSSDPAPAAIVDPAAPAAVVPAAVVPAAVAPVKPEGLPDSYWDATAGVKPEAYTRLVELETAEAARVADVPADGKYTLTVPDDLKDLEGEPITIKADDPLAKGLLEAAAKHKLPASVVNELTALYVQGELEAARAMQTEQAAELAKLGTGAKARIDAYSTALKAHAGPKAQALIDAIGSAEAVEAVEALLAKMAGAQVLTPPAQEQPKPFEGLHGADLLTAARAAQRTGR